MGCSTNCYVDLIQNVSYYSKYLYTQSNCQISYLQKDVPEAKLTPWHILRSVLADEVCVQWYIKEN